MQLPEEGSLTIAWSVEGPPRRRRKANRTLGYGAVGVAETPSNGHTRPSRSGRYPREWHKETISQKLKNDIKKGVNRFDWYLPESVIVYHSQSGIFAMRANHRSDPHTY